MWTRGTNRGTRDATLGRGLSWRIRLALAGVDWPGWWRLAGATSEEKTAVVSLPPSLLYAAGVVFLSTLRTATLGQPMGYRDLTVTAGGLLATAAAGRRMSNKVATGTSRRRRRGCTPLALRCPSLSGVAIPTVNIVRSYPGVATTQRLAINDRASEKPRLRAPRRRFAASSYP